MTKTSRLVVAALFVFSTAAFAQNPPEVNNPNVHHFPVQGWARPGGGGAQNLIYHTGAPVIQVAHVVFIFWGPSFSNPLSPDSTYAQTLQNFRNQYGTNPEYN